MCITQHRNNPGSPMCCESSLGVLWMEMCVADWDVLVPAIFFYCTVVAWALAQSPSPPNQLFSSSFSSLEVVLLPVSCADSLQHATGLVLVNVNNEILRMMSSVCSVLMIMYCEHCHHLGDWVITYLRQLNGLPFVFFFAIKQEVLLHHPSEGPGVSIPQRVASRAARRDVEDLPAHVWRANPDARRAALLLRGLRLVGMHPAAVHGLSLQPGQQQTGREEGTAAPAGQKQQGEAVKPACTAGCSASQGRLMVTEGSADKSSACIVALSDLLYCKHFKEQLIPALIPLLITRAQITCTWLHIQDHWYRPAEENEAGGIKTFIWWLDQCCVREHCRTKHIQTLTPPVGLNPGLFP